MYRSVLCVHEATRSSYGGHSSVTLAEIHEQMDQRYPDLTEITDLFEHQTLMELADFLNKKIAEQSRN